MSGNVYLVTLLVGLIPLYGVRGDRLPDRLTSDPDRRPIRDFSELLRTKLSPKGVTGDCRPERGDSYFFCFG